MYVIHEMLLIYSTLFLSCWIFIDKCLRHQDGSLLGCDALWFYKWLL